MNAKNAICVVFALVSSAATSVHAVGAALSKVHWVESTLVQADFNGDGRSDRFVMGTIGNQVVAAVTLAGTTMPQVLMFPQSEIKCSPALFDKSCEIPEPKLEVMRLTKDTFSELRHEFDLDSTNVFVQSGKSEAVWVPVDETDPYLIFWNAETRKLDWARL